jgi:hypothetical protein
MILSHIHSSLILETNFRKIHLNNHPTCGDQEKNSPTVAHACRKRQLKWVLGAWGYNWATQSPGDINMEIWSSRLGVGSGADDPTPEKVNS